MSTSASMNVPRKLLEQVVPSQVISKLLFQLKCSDLPLANTGPDNLVMFLVVVIVGMSIN